jgi:Txe/YoeB family toxin of Txe-Axe toxin-antitoxin module
MSRLSDILNERSFKVKDGSLTDIVVDKITDLTDGGKKEPAEIKQALNDIKAIVKKDSYTLPKTLSRFETQIMKVISNLPDDEFDLFMQKISDRDEIVSVKNVLTGGKIKTINSINPSWLPQSIIPNLMNIKEDKMGPGEIYFSMIMGGDKEKKGDVRIGNIELELKSGKAWLIEFPTTIDKLEDLLSDVRDDLTMNESLTENLTQKEKLVKSANTNLKKYINNKQTLYLIVDLFQKKINIKNQNSAMAFTELEPLTRLETKIYTMIKEADVILKWLYKPQVGRGADFYFNDTSLKILDYMTTLVEQMKKEKNPSKNFISSLKVMEKYLDLSIKNAEEVEERSKDTKRILNIIDKTDRNHFLFQSSKKHLWNDIFKAYSRNITNGEEKFIKMFTKFIDDGFTWISHTAVLKGAISNNGIDSEVILKNILKESFDAYKKEGWDHLLAITQTKKYYATFSTKEEFIKAIDNNILFADLIYAPGRSQSARIHLELRK